MDYRVSVEELEREYEMLELARQILIASMKQIDSFENNPTTLDETEVPSILNEIK